METVLKMTSGMITIDDSTVGPTTINKVSNVPQSTGTHQDINGTKSVYVRQACDPWFGQEMETHPLKQLVWMEYGHLEIRTEWIGVRA